MVLFAVVALLHRAASYAGNSFALKEGDRVVFYGDSITDNGAYTKYAEVFVRTRYPRLNVHFFNAGVGGDRVSGGWMGPVDKRLTRDVFARKPSVITVMLGMNDGAYHASDITTFDTYASGYRHIVSRIEKEAPDAKVWLIQPSPYDDVTRPPHFPEGYNSVMKSYGTFVADLSQQHHFGTVDFNDPMVSMLQRVKAVDEPASEKLIPDRVHPSDVGHLVMAAALAKSWHAPELVSSVNIDALTGNAHTQYSVVNEVRKRGELSWTQRDEALPFAYHLENASENLVRSVYPLENFFGRQTVAAQNLAEGTYELTIDDMSIGKFSASQLSQGIDLTHTMTPMLRQALTVSDLVWRRAGVGYQTWRSYEFGLQDEPEWFSHDIIRASQHLDELFEAKIKAAAKPLPHRFRLKRIG